MNLKTRLKRIGLITCLFVFLLTVIGGGLRLNPLSALIAASTGTPLILAVTRWCSGIAVRRNAES